MWFREAIDKYLFINSKFSHTNSTAHIKNTFTINSDLTDEKHFFDDPEVHHLENIVEYAVEGCMHFFHQFKYKREKKRKLVRGEDGQREAHLTIKNC